MNKDYLKVAIYLRLSDEDKDKTNKLDDSESIKNQRNLLLDEIRKNPKFKLVDEYCDEDLSGAGTYRPEFERLIKDCENGKIDIVLCKSQSRFSRDMEIIEKYIHNKFIEWNIRFIGLVDNADTNIQGNKKSRQINGLVNEWYLEDISNNIRSAFQTKMKQGEFISPFTSFGYEISKENNNKIIIDPVAAKIVKDIFRLYLKGMCFTGIAKYLNEKKIPSPSFYKYKKGSKLNIISNRPIEEIKWSANAIKTILTNELYIGNLVQGKRTTISYKNHKIIKKNKNNWIRRENTHEAIIDNKTFDKVQKYINERTKAGKNTGIVHNFSGKVFCLECNKYMKKKNSKLHEYLSCSSVNNGYNDCINKKSIRYDDLENVILKAINEKIKNYYDEKILFKILANNTKNTMINELSLLEKQKIECKKKLLENKRYLKSLYEDKVNKIITNEQFKELTINYTNNENFYTNQIKFIESKINLCKNKKFTINDNKNSFIKYKVIKKLNKLIVDEFIFKIYIGKLDENNKRIIKIIWNF